MKYILHSLIDISIQRERERERESQEYSTFFFGHLILHQAFPGNGEYYLFVIWHYKKGWSIFFILRQTFRDRVKNICYSSLEISPLENETTTLSWNTCHQSVTWCRSNTLDVLLGSVSFESPPCLRICRGFVLFPLLNASAVPLRTLRLFCIQIIFLSQPIVYSIFEHYTATSAWLWETNLTKQHEKNKWGREDEIFNFKEKICVIWPQENRITKYSYKQFKLNYYGL